MKELAFTLKFKKGKIMIKYERVQKYTDATKKYREQDEEDGNSSQERINMYKKKKPVHKSKLKFHIRLSLNYPQVLKLASMIFHQ